MVLRRLPMPRRSRSSSISDAVAIGRPQRASLVVRSAPKVAQLRHEQCCSFAVTLRPTVLARLHTTDDQVLQTDDDAAQAAVQVDGLAGASSKARRLALSGPAWRPVVASFERQHPSRIDRAGRASMPEKHPGT